MCSLPPSPRALRNPGTFYWSLEAPRDWTTPQNADLWRDEAKTLFDPCPAGWRVPPSGASGSIDSPWNAFATEDLLYANGSWSADDLCGRWSVNGGTAWYPVPGARYRASAFVNTAIAGHNWSTTLDSDHRVYYFRLDATRVMPGLPELNHAYGFSVRCVRE